MPDLAGNANGVFGAGIGSTTGNRWEHSALGLALTADDAGTGTVDSVVLNVGSAAGSGAPTGNVFSIQARVRFVGDGSIYSAQGTGAQLRLTSSRVEFLHRSVALIASGGTSLTAGTDVDIGVSYDGTTATLYVNGRQDGTGSLAVSFTHSQQYTLFNGGGGSASERAPNGTRIYWLGVWQRTRSASEFAQLAQAPALLFRPRQRRIWVPPAGGATVHDVSASEALTLSDAAAVSLVAAVAQSEALSLSEAVARLVIAAAAAAESATLVEAQAASAVSATSQAESMSLAESSARAMQTSRAVAESAPLADSQATVLVTTLAISESLPLIDSSSTAPLVAAAMVEALSLSDVAAAALSALAAAAEAMPLADVVAVQIQSSRGVIEALALADAITAQGPQAAAIVEALTLTEAQTAPGVQAALIAEALTLADFVVVATPGGAVSVFWRIDVQGANLRFDILAASLRYDIPPAAARIDAGA